VLTAPICIIRIGRWRRRPAAKQIDVMCIRGELPLAAPLLRLIIMMMMVMIMLQPLVQQRTPHFHAAPRVAYYKYSAQSQTTTVSSSWLCNRRKEEDKVTETFDVHITCGLQTSGQKFLLYYIKDVALLSQQHYFFVCLQNDDSTTESKILLLSLFSWFCSPVIFVSHLSNKKNRLISL
jgi:hypothetical protein